MGNFGVYRITNTETLLSYIGSTGKGFEGRWKNHKKRLRNHEHNPKFQEAWDQYGPEKWEWVVVEEMTPVKSPLLEREQHWIDFYDSYKNGYNASPHAGSRLGCKLTEEHKKKISLMHSGKPKTEAFKRMVSRVHKGKVLSLETRQKISQARMGKGHPHTKENRARLTAVLQSPEVREKIRQAHLGTHMPEEDKVKARNTCHEKRIRKIEILDNQEFLTLKQRRYLLGLKASERKFQGLPPNPLGRPRVRAKPPSPSTT